MKKTMRRREDFPSIIGEDVTFKGKLTSSEELLVAGKLIGTIQVDSTLYALPSAQITKKVEATNCSLQGATVKAEIHIKENLALLQNANVDGTVHTTSLQIENGSTINGTIVMDRIINAKES